MAFSYSGRAIRAILPLQDGKPLFCGLWRKLCDLGIAKFKHTCRGCRAGLKKSDLLSSLPLVEE